MIKCMILAIIILASFNASLGQQTVPQACLDAFRSAMLLRHNEVRLLHGVPLQSANSSLDAQAQSWADGIANGTNGFNHSPPSYYGENLGLIKITGLVADAPTCTSLAINMTNAWYNEISLYNYSNPTYSSTTGHFTQIVWKATLSLGVGIGNSATNAFYGVAQYVVAGNVATKTAFQANVLPQNPYVAPQTVIMNCLTAFRVSMVQRHNQLRALHGVGPLSENQTLNDQAQGWANGMSTGAIAYGHSAANGYGENLAMIKISGLLPTVPNCASLAINMTNAWYNEISLYDFNNPSYSSATGHFTQVVWKATNTIGIGFGVSSTNAFYGVAQYYVPGNVASTSAFTANVLRLI